MSHVDVATFERRYQDEPDPWGFASSEYEQRKYDLTMASLPLRRYGRAFEPGCAIGELTRRLAARCDVVEAMDASPTVVARARDRNARMTNVRVSVGELPDDWPDGSFDLIVLSEIGYYFSLHELANLRDRAVASLDPRGTLVAVHWRGTSPDHLLHGDVVHRCLRSATELTPVVRHLEARFVLDAWERA
jgi:SAM-dependent methyltransferase